MNTTQKNYKIANFLFFFIALSMYLLCLYSSRDYFYPGDNAIQCSWWNFINQYGFNGISLLNYNGGDYTTIWYFIIYLFIKLGIFPLYSVARCIKIIATVCSLVSGISIYFIVKHYKPNSKHAAIFSFVAALYSPPLLCDLLKSNLPNSVYIMFALLAFLFFIKNHKWLAYFFLGFGICFKLMAVYLLFFFLYFYIKDFKKYSLLERLSPLSMLMSLIICSIPNMIAGGRFIDGIIYPILNRSSSSSSLMANHNLSLWQILPNNAASFQLFAIGLFVLIFSAVYIFILFFIPNNRKSYIELNVLLPLCPMISYYLLPAQHESYFDLACVFTLFIFLINPKIKTLVPCALLNILLLMTYSWVVFQTDKSYNVLYPYVLQFSSLVFASVMFYYGYQLFENSVFCCKNNM